MTSKAAATTKPFVKVQQVTNNTPVVFECVDTTGAYIDCNYISVAFIASVATAGYAEISLSAINGNNIAHGNSTSGTLGGIATVPEKFEVYLPGVTTCSSVTVTAKNLLGTAYAAVTYGAYRETNKLRLIGRSGGV